MMPWNPIHRYAGLQTALDSSVAERFTVDPTNGVTSDPFGQPGLPEPEISFGHAAAAGGKFTDDTRRPLGFIDVRSEAGDAGSRDADANGVDVPSEGSTSTEAEAPAEEPWVPGFAAVARDDSETEAEKKVPFYKREVSLGRKKTAPPERDRGEQAEPAPIDRPSVDPTPVAAEELEADVKVPFYKREISVRRRRDEPRAIEVDAVEVDEAPKVIAWDVADEPQATEARKIDETSLVSADMRHETQSPSSALGSAAEGVEVDAGVAERDVPVVESAADGEAEIEWPEHVATPAEPIAVPPVVAARGVAGPAVPEIPVVHAAPAAVPAAAKVPLHKRELSFGKARSPKTSPSARNGARRAGRIVGLKIGASQLAAAVVEEHDGRPELVALARTPLEAGIVVDGEVRDAEALTNALRTFFAENKLPTRDVRIGIASNRLGVRTFDIAGVDDATRFDNAVRFKAHEVLPIAGNESVLDYRVLDERQSPTGETTRRIFLVVAPRDQIAPYVEAVQRAGLRLAGVDLESLGLLRAFVEPQDLGARKSTDTATVVVAIGHEGSTLMVSGGGACEFTRVFDWGGNILQDAIAQELDVRPAEAATILRHLSLAGGGARIEGFADEDRSKAVEAVRLRLTPFARELVSSLQFYQTQPDSLGIGEIVITGGTSQLDGLADALNQMIGVSVRVGNPLQRVMARKGVETGFEPVIGSLAVAIGLGIDDGAVRSVDLTPRDLAKVRSNKTRLLPVLLPIAAIVPLAVAGFLFVQTHGKVSDRQSQLSELNSRFAALPVPKRPQIDPALEGLQAQRALAVAQVLGGRTAWDSMLTDLARVLPGNVWLTALSAHTAHPLSTTSLAAATPAAKPTSSVTVAAAPTGVTIGGDTYTQADVATLLARLSALPSLQNVQLGSSQAATVGQKDVIEFTILADLHENGGGS